MRELLVGLVALSLLTTTTTGVTTTSFLTSADQSRLIGIFKSALDSASDGATLHHAVKGLHTLGAAVEAKDAVCGRIKSQLSQDNLESIYHAASAASMLRCQLDISDSAASLLSDSITSPSTVTALFHAVSAATSLGRKFDGASALSALSALLKKDDGILAMGYGFHVAASVGASQDVKRFYDRIEDAMEQADEVDGRLLQFEGGLYTSAVVVDGAFRLASVAGADSVAPADKVVKMVNYFVSRKNVHHVKSAAWMVAVIKTLNSNDFMKPVVVRRFSPVAIPTSNRRVVVSATDLMGASLGDVRVVADSLVKKGDAAPIVGAISMSSTSDETLYELDFSSAGDDAKRGFYVLTVSVEAKEPKEGVLLIGNKGALVDLTVITEVSVENVEIGIADRDQSVAPKTTRVQYPNKVPTMLEVDSQQKVIMKFSLKDVNDPSSDSLLVHQAFVRLSHRETGKDVFFVADVESGSGVYKFDMDVGASAKEFASHSGKYSMSLIIGDTLIANPVAWELVEMRLSFQGEPTPTTDHANQYVEKPEISHLFRVPEKRPPRSVSLTFTSLVVLPLLLLLIVWAKLGANVDGLSGRNIIHVLLFHGTLGGVLLLMYLYWTCLDMFATLKYLGALSVVLFLSGNRLLASIAETKRK